MQLLHLSLWVHLVVCSHLHERISLHEFVQSDRRPPNLRRYIVQIAFGGARALQLVQQLLILVRLYRLISLPRLLSKTLISSHSFKVVRDLYKDEDSIFDHG
jgi:hypothetical protein